MPTPTPTLQDVVRRTSPSLVQVTSNVSAGSGFIVDSGQGVITNAHVVGDDSRVSVWLHDGRELQGRVVGLDEYLDLAYIRLPDGQRLQSAVMGNSARVSPGQDVLALGFPLDSSPGDSPIVTKGIVSSVRTVDGAKWIQTDAPVNPGSSGGPLMDNRGRVIGVVTSRLDYDWDSGRDVEGVGFALAVDELKDRLDFLSGGGQALLPTPTPRPTPRPTATPIPRPSPSTGDRGWIYFGPECPRAYLNCAPSSSNTSFVALGAFSHTNKSPHTEPNIIVGCFPEPTFFFLGGGPNIGTGTVLEIRVGDDGAEGFYTPADGTDDGVYLDSDDSGDVINLVRFADGTGLTVIIGIASDFGTILGRFNPRGFTTNYFRLPCAS